MTRMTGTTGLGSLKRRALAALAAMMILASALTGYAAEAPKAGFTYNKIRYSVGMDANTARQTLGEAKSSRDVNNCANGYINKAYTYGETGDFEVLIEQNEAGQEIISNITLLTGQVATEEGLRVGDPESRITALYPTARKGLSTYTVIMGTGTLYIKTKAGKISFISYI